MGSVIVVGSFYEQTLELVWTEDANDNWKNEKEQKSVLLDKAGWYFEVEFHDVNGDGAKDLLATTWSRRDDNGRLIAYELQANDWRQTTNWHRHDLYTRFPRFLMTGFGSPGGFSTNVLGQSDSGKEVIWTSGDDDGKIYQHTPVSEESGIWRYNTKTIYETNSEIEFSSLTGATIGEVTSGDLNADGKTDIFVSNYFLKQILVLEQV